MSRWRSPQTAAKRADRAAKDAGQLRKEERNNRLMLAAIILLMMGSAVADWYFIRWTRHTRHRQFQAQHTNQTGIPLPESKP